MPTTDTNMGSICLNFRSILIFFFFVTMVLGIIPDKKDVKSDNYKDTLLRGILSRTRRSVTEITLTSTVKTAIVDAHNTYRRAQSASDMEYMYWHDGLATQAKAWADGCDFVHGGNGKHGSWSRVGQNLAWNSGSQDAVNMVKLWYDEIADYTYDTNGCSGICGHYTQVVWAASKHIGCAFVQCTPLTDTDVGTSYTTGNYLVCHYGPPGNYQGSKPYAKGSECTRCGSGTYTCDNGLCRDCSGDGTQGCGCTAQCENCGTVNQTSCTCECQQGYLGDRCQDECKDTHANCNNGWWPENCAGYAPARAGCPIMCKECTAPDGSCVTTPRESTTTSAATKQTTQSQATATKTTSGSNNGDCATAITCLNGGSPDSPSAVCSCVCTSDWQGDTCQFQKDEAKKGVVLSILTTTTTEWTDIWTVLKPIIGNMVNEECKKNEGSCECKNDSGYAFRDKVATGKGYPYTENDKVQSLVYVDGAVCSSSTPVPQNILHSAIMGAKDNITSSLTTCCGASLQAVEKGTVTGVDSGAARWRCTSLFLLVSLSQLMSCVMF